MVRLRRDRDSATVVRPPAVAGRFYPADPVVLRAAVDTYLRDAATPGDGVVPKALVVPHAGYVYSGPVAASAYARLAPVRAVVHRVILVGPSHYVPLLGLAASRARAFETPLGRVAVDVDLVARARELPQVRVLERAHAAEHSLEVQLPFLQRVLEDFALVPLAAGEALADDVGEVLDRLWGGTETLIVVSSDLSHYHDEETARRLDAETAAAIESLSPGSLGEESACGRVGIGGLLVSARRHGLRAHRLDLRNSADTAGPDDRVVGYGAWAFA
jgi:hypothetical protein